MSPQTVTAPDLVADEVIRTFLATVEAEPYAPLGAVVPAPGGYGKTTLLAAVARLYRQAGVPVHDSWPAGSAPVHDLRPDEHVLLVDDAHLLDDARLGQLHRLARSGQARLVLAYRPWPRPAGLAGLIDLLTRDGRALPLAPYDADRTATHLARVAGGGTPAPATVAFVRWQTGGVPRLVDRLARALHAAGVRDDPPVEVPEPAVAAVGTELDRLDEDVRRLLLATATGADLPAELLTDVLAVDPAGVARILAAARACGLLCRDDRLPPLVRRGVLAFSPATERAATGLRLAQRQLRRGGRVLPLVRPLLGTGLGGCPAALLAAAADEAMADEPALSAQLFAAAAAAGEPAPARHAVAAALAGDLDTALRLADGLVGAADAADRAAGAAVVAAALTHRGQPGRAADLHRWAGTGSSLAFAAVGTLGTGDRDELDRLLRQPPVDGPPTLSAGAALQTARGVRETLDAPPTTALSTLVQASALLEPAGRAVLLPDSPAALAALVAIQCGELEIADGVLERAVTAGTGAALMARRHGLLRAWVLMVRGRTGAAGERLGGLIAASGSADAESSPLEARDLLFLAALELGIARRDSDLPALQRAWEGAREALVRHPVDLFTLLPLGEFAVAAARLGELPQVAPYLRQAWELLSRLGEPPLWSAALHWSALHAAVLAEQPAAADEHVAALTTTAGHSRYATAVAAAAQSWVEVLHGRVDPVRVEAAARGLHGTGLCWDGARLAGQAAIRTADRRAMTALLDCARMLQGRIGGPRAAATPARASREPVPDAVTGESRLSDREQEVADLILAGMTYRQVGNRLFISAKTVEHHVARMRQRLNCGSRSELLARLRAMAERTGRDPSGRPWPGRPGAVVR